MIRTNLKRSLLQSTWLKGGVILFASTLYFLGNSLPAQAASIPISGNAWSGFSIGGTDFSGMGWVSFNGTATDASKSAYGVYEDTSTGTLSGDAWSSTYGWISFNSSSPNDLSGCPSGTCLAQVNLSTGKLSGWARVLSAPAAGSSAGGWDGWISLSGVATDSSSSPYGVTSSGGCWTGNAWGGPVDTGWISFSGIAQDRSTYKVGDGSCGSTISPTASLSANPTSITSGSSSTLTYACTNSASASISPGFNSVTPVTGGSVSVSPTKTTLYTLTCTAADGTTAQNQATVAITASPLAVSCSVTPASASTNQLVTWVIGGGGASGGSGSGYSYAWTLTGGSPASGNGSSIQNKYTSSGTYNGSVTVTDSMGNTQSSSCSNNVAVSPPPVTTAALTCNPSSISSGGSATVSWSSTNAASCTGTNFSTGGATSGSVSTGALSTSQTYSLQCQNSSGTSTANDSCTVTPITGPVANLTAGDTTDSPSSTIVGQMVSFFADVLNNGNAPASNFPNTFEVGDANKQPYAMVAAQLISSLSPGASQRVNGTYVFNTPGTYFIRACANTDTNWNHSAPESNYNDNCGGWPAVAITVGTCTSNCGGNTPSVACTGSNPSGNNATWTATPSNFTPTSYTWSPTSGTTPGTQPGGSGNPFSNSYPASGSYSEHVVATAGPQSAQADCPVTVGSSGGVCGTPNPTISANPNRVQKGNTSVISWSATNAASCTVTGTDGFSQSDLQRPAKSCTVPTDRATRAITQQTTYCITCDSGTPVCTTVNILPAFQEF